MATPITWPPRLCGGWSPAPAWRVNISSALRCLPEIANMYDYFGSVLR